MKVDISVIVVSWNSRRFLERCIKSVLKCAQNLTYEIIVVDNASSDGSADFVRDTFPTVNLIKLPSNTGFSHACNVGITYAKGSYLCFLNPDTELLNNALPHLVSFMDQHPRAGITGGMLQDPDGRVQYSIRSFPGPLIALGMMIKLHHIPIVKRLFYAYFKTDFNYMVAQQVDQVMGAFFVVRKLFLDQVGGFDERFFLWFDDVDLMRQAHESGWQVWYYPNARAIHWGAQSFSQVSSYENQKQFLKSLRQYIEKWHGSFAALPLMLLKPVVLLCYRILPVRKKSVSDIISIS
ncbi:MAG: glycosyltransferase family 2 protein [Patescibacteria group bacterium]